MATEALLNENTYISIGALLVVVSAAVRLNRTIGKLTVSVDGLRKDMRRVGRRIDRRLTRSDFIGWLDKFRLMNPTLQIPALAPSEKNDQPDDDNDENEEM